MNIDQQIEQAAELLAESESAVALTGAGISTPSGIPDFRSPGSGLWNNVNPMDVATIFAFNRNPQAFYDWIHPFANVMVGAEPNLAHHALAQMEACGLINGLITQNIDMLHGKAGSKNVYEVHGHLREATCVSCFSVFPAKAHLDLFISSGAIPRCDLCGGVLKPNLILFGEQLPVDVMNKARKLAASCDLMLVAGSSLQTAPAGDLPFLAKKHGARLIITNQQPTPVDYLAEVVIRANVVDVLPRLVAPFLEQ